MHALRGLALRETAIGAGNQVFLADCAGEIDDALGDKLRVNVELTDPSTRLAVWSGRIERAGADRQAVQDEIVGQLARELHFELYPVGSARRSNDADATRGRLSR